MTRPNNAVLQNLPAASYERLNNRLERIEAERGVELHSYGDLVHWVYFPVGALLSLITAGATGQQVETMMVGTEGAAGLVEVCAGQHATVDCLVQIDGACWRAPADACRELAMSDLGFASVVLRMTEIQLVETRQSGFCQASHTVEARFARWLCECMERTGGRNPLPLTQEFLAAMLGVQRTTVTAYASELQRQGVIRYSRGRLEVLDLEGLKTLACECRSSVADRRKDLGFQCA